MPGPFPGMDPYLEDPLLWRGVHHRLITYLADTLNEILPKPYIANIEERLYVVQSDRDIYPDVLLRHQRPTPLAPQTGNGIALVEETDQPLVVTDMAREVVEPFVEVRWLGGPTQVVTVIEILSPTNKAAHSPGREHYLQKQDEVLHSKVHLLEIDLLRYGAHTVAAPLTELLARRRWDFLISLHRAGVRDYETWPITLRERLPRVRVPLRATEKDLALDLQKMLDHCYEAGRYGQQINYADQPNPPLTDADAAWLDALLREKDLRT